MAPLFSVIIPLYNKENSIEGTVRSVLNQEYTDFELLVVDDGSTDNSLKKLKIFTDKRLKIISKKNGGVSEARNFGVKKAKGEFIFFLDADDVITANCLSTFYSLVKKHSKLSVFTANFKKIFPNNKSEIYCIGKQEGIVLNKFKSLWEKVIFPRTGSLLIKKECFQEVGFFKTSLTIYEDLEFILKLLKKYDIVYSPNVVLMYQCEFNELSEKKVPVFKDFAFTINLKEASNYYEKLILSEVLYGTYLKRKRLKDFDSCKLLINQNKKYIIFIIWEIIIKKKIKKYVQFF